MLADAFFVEYWSIVSPALIPLVAIGVLVWAVFAAHRAPARRGASIGAWVAGFVLPGLLLVRAPGLAWFFAITLFEAPVYPLAAIVACGCLTFMGCATGYGIARYGEDARARSSQRCCPAEPELG